MRFIQAALITLALSMSVGAGARPTADQPKVIEITAKRFEYAPSKVSLKKGETVTLRVASLDVTHGLFVRPLKIDTDIPAGETKEITITPQNVGTFTAICHHFCGSGHGNMKMVFEVVE